MKVEVGAYEAKTKLPDSCAAYRRVSVIRLPFVVKQSQILFPLRA